MARRTALISAILLSYAAVTLAAVERNAGDCVNPSLLGSGGLSAFPESLRIVSSSGAAASGTSVVQFAQGFSVEYFGTYKIVKNVGANETYVLYQCGTTAPAASAIPGGAKLFQIPLAGVSVPDTTALAFVDALGLGGRVEFTSQYAVNPCMQSLGLGGCQKIAMAPWDNATLVSAQAANVDAFLLYGGSSNSKSISVMASPEPGMLGRAEWVKFVATFFNKEPEAAIFFDTVSTKYQAIKAAAASVVPKNGRPVVAFLGYTPPQWGTESISVAFAGYKLQLIQDAGGQPLNLTAIQAAYPNVTFKFNSLQLTNMTTAPAILKDILMNVALVVDESSYDVSSSELTLQDFMTRYGFATEDISNFDFLRNQKIIREDGVANPNGDTAWFEGAVPRPDLVLLDLSNAIATGNAQSVAVLQAAAGSDTGGFLWNLETQKPVVLEAKQCPLASCTIQSSIICPFVYMACNGSAAYADEVYRCAPKCASPGAGSPPPLAATVLRPLMFLAMACVLFASLIMLS